MRLTSLLQPLVILEGWGQRRVALVRRFPEASESIDALASLDPSPNKEYVEWLVLQWRRDRTILDSSMRVARALEFFHANKNKAVLSGKTDIHDKKIYPTWEDFCDDISILRREAKLAEEAKVGMKAIIDRSVVHDDETWKILKFDDTDTHTCNAVAHYSKNMWCVADPGVARDYLEDGPLYLILKHDGERWRRMALCAIGGRVSPACCTIKNGLNREWSLPPDLIPILARVLEADNIAQACSVGDCLGVRLARYESMILKELGDAISNPNRTEEDLDVCWEIGRYVMMAANGNWPEADSIILDKVASGNFSLACILTYMTMSKDNQRWPELEDAILALFDTEPEVADRAGIDYISRMHINGWPEFRAKHLEL